MLSFQRFARPEAGVVDRAPASLGALPVGLGAAHELILPLADDECFWIGLSVTSATRPIALAVAVELRSRKILDAISGTNWDAGRPTWVIVPDTPRIDGIRRPDGRFEVLARETRDAADGLCVRIRLRIVAAGGDDKSAAAPDAEICEVPLRLVDYATFAAETGTAPPAPLDPDAGYKGWRLP
ncbi:MAG: hypothetical protein ABJA84_00300 [Polaromonas sp.]